MLGVIIKLLFVVGAVGIVVGTLFILFDAGAEITLGVFSVGIPALIISLGLFVTLYRVDIQYTDIQGNAHSYKSVAQVSTDRGNLTFRDKDDVVHNVKFSTYKTTD